MSISSSERLDPPADFASLAAALAWGAWVELGVSGWAASHRDWAIDPEPLVVFTAGMTTQDPRLVDEATDWCIRNWRHLSKTRLRNLVRDEPQQVRDEFGVFAATVGDHAGIVWPDSTKPRRYSPTGRSTEPQLDRSSMVWLRLRATFGLGARAEILRYFLTRGPAPASAAMIASFANYTKRNVAAECEALAQAGLLRVSVVGNRHDYSLVKRSEVEALLGGIPDVLPNWTAIFHVARVLSELESQAAGSTDRTLAVKTRKALDEIGPDLDQLEVGRPPSTVTGSALWPAAQAVGTATLRRWSTGQDSVSSAGLEPTTS